VILRDWGVEAERVGAGGVPLPAQRDDRETEAEEPGVAGGVREIFVATIHQRQDARAAAVGILEEERAVRLGRIFGADGDEVGGELDFAAPEVDGVREIYDALVVYVRYADGEKNFPCDAFVGAGVAEGLAVETSVRVAMSTCVSRAERSGRKDRKQKKTANLPAARIMRGRIAERGRCSVALATFAG